MVEQKICQNCGQRTGCKEIYRQLGDRKGPSVLLKVIAAFLLPMLVFAASITVFENIFTNRWHQRGFATIVSLLIALAITCAFMIVLKAVSRKFAKNK